MIYTPAPNTLAGRVLQFFAQNPGEYLTAHDIALKFGEGNRPVDVHAELVIALDHEALQWDAAAEVYRLGTMPAVAPADCGAPAPAACTAPGADSARQRLGEIRTLLLRVIDSLAARPDTDAALVDVAKALALTTRGQSTRGTAE
ncbi:MAG: hypothetical protein KBC94_23100 [Pseudacidovorax sp.]|uniref:hypothetical protein n=1 Tax=Pseudacidovorax sp. TaxID=1934311 RepID=UPI001B5A5FEA|nr:hypothetical protein [Pseudacidovorax sp.]MBP6897314.1 hypothetical protein [Pseudacidovorax sp.]